MKKLLAILLCLSLAISLCACVPSSVKDAVDELQDEVSSAIDEAINSEETKVLSRGVIVDKVYSSEYSGLKFTRPDSWVYATDDEIATTMGVDTEALGTDFEELTDNNSSVYDMMVSDINTGSNINLGYENLTASNSTNITEEQYLDAVKNQLSTVTNMITEFEDGYETVKLSGQDYLRAICKTTVNGIEMTQVYYLRKIDKYMNFVIVTIVDDYTVSDIEAMFS